MPCMCGADDCRSCFPGNFTRVGNHHIYLGDLDEDEIQEAIDDAENAQVDAYLDAMEEKADAMADIAP